MVRIIMTELKLRQDPAPFRPHFLIQQIRYMTSERYGSCKRDAVVIQTRNKSQMYLDWFIGAVPLLTRQDPPVINH
jgi:hypothetical protein